MTVAYRDGRAYWNKKNYPAGIFATNFLNLFYKNDTAARISVFSDEINHNILKQLRCGYLNIRNFTDTGRIILEELKALPNIPVYSTLDFDAIREALCRYGEKLKERMWHNEKMGRRFIYVSLCHGTDGEETLAGIY